MRIIHLRNRQPWNPDYDAWLCSGPLSPDDDEEEEDEDEEDEFRWDEDDHDLGGEGSWV